MKQTIPSSKELPVLSFKTSGQWEKWLEKNYENIDGIWLKIFKKDSGIKSINYAMALDVALCFGWIDGIKKNWMRYLISKNSHQEGPGVFGHTGTRNISNDSR